MLLTIPVCMNAQNTLVAVDDAVVKAGRMIKRTSVRLK